MGRWLIISNPGSFPVTWRTRSGVVPQSKSKWRLCEASQEVGWRRKKKQSASGRA